MVVSQIAAGVVTGVVISGDDAFRTLIDFGTSTNEVLGTAEEEEEEAAIDEAMSIFY